MKGIQQSLFPSRTTTELVEDIKKLNTEIQELYCLDSIPWVVGYSGGKDSTATLQLIWNAIAELPQKRRVKTIHIITTDTLVENPIVSAWVTNSLKLMEESAKNKKLPIQCHLLKPEVKQTYWVGLLGNCLLYTSDAADDP